MFRKMMSLLLTVLLCLGTAAGCANAANTGTSGEVPAQNQEKTETGEPAATQQPVEEQPPAATDAEIQLVTDESGAESLAVQVRVPGGATVTIAHAQQTLYTYTNPGAEEQAISVNLPIEQFMPNAPLTEAETEIGPEITITAADGTSYPAKVASFPYAFPKLELTFLSPESDETGCISAEWDNTVQITGTVEDYTVRLSVNGTPLQVFENGVFSYEFRFDADATPDTTETLRFVAEKDNCVSAEREITVRAYPIVLSTGRAILRADENGVAEVTGAVRSGMTLAAQSDDAVCDPVSVADDGTFSLRITTAGYGLSTVTLEGTGDGETARMQLRIARGFADKGAFQSYYSENGSLLTEFSVADLLADPALYASDKYGYSFSATVEEIVERDGERLVRMTIPSTGETVYVYNLSEKWAPEGSIGETFKLWCSFIGVDEPTGCGAFAAWFAAR